MADDLPATYTAPASFGDDEPMPSVRLVTTSRDTLIAAMDDLLHAFMPDPMARHIMAEGTADGLIAPLGMRANGVVRVLDLADPTLIDAACYWCGICVGGRCDDCRAGKAERIKAIFDGGK